MAKDRKRKSSDTVKAQRKQAKWLGQENSQKGRSGYYRYDGGQNATEIPTDISPEQLHNLMKEFYIAKVKVTESQAEAIRLETTGQGSNDDSLYKWLAERRCHITASNTGSIAKRRTTTKVASAVKQLLYAKFTGNNATRWVVAEKFVPVKISVREQNFQEKLFWFGTNFSKKWTDPGNFVPGEILHFHCIMHATITCFTNRPFNCT